MLQSAFLQEATDRGFVFQTTDAERLDAALTAGPVAAYIGFDCTADSLHVGSLVQIMILRLLQRHGHKPVVLMGGGTTRIGDPSGKDEARLLLTDAQIAANMAGIRRCFEPFLRFGDGPSDAVMADNGEWLNELGYIPLLREVGIHFTVNRMLSFDSVRLRLEREQPLTFLEFNYMILQSYDFRELARRLDVSLQIGGSDQWGNIVAGIELGRRTDGRALHGLTTPLIATASGAKMGKSGRGAVWLTADRLPPYDYWQFWRDTDDTDVGRFLRLFTDLSLDEITRLETGDVNEAKKVLASEATRLCHGAEAAEMAAGAAVELFARSSATSRAKATLSVGVEVPRNELLAGIPAFRLFVLAGLASSNGEARRLIRGGGARVNDAAVADEGQLVSAEDLREGAIKLSAGRKQHRLVRVAE